MSADLYVVLTAVVYVLAVARVTRLINFDAILDRPRVAIVRFVRGNPVVVYFLTCPWCVSIWVALGTAWIPLHYSRSQWAVYLGVFLAASHLTGIGAPLSADESIKVEGDYVAPDDVDTAD